MFCENCGHELKEEDRFCPECGTPVRENGFFDSEDSTKADAPANMKSAEEMSATQTEKTPSKTHKERKTKKGRKGRTFLAVFFLLFFCAVAVMAFYPGSPIREMFFQQDDSASAEQSDDIGVGEIYYQEIDPEHVAETDSGMIYADNEILVVAQDGVTFDEIEELARQYDAEIVGWIEITGDYQWLLSGTFTKEELEELAAELEEEELIESASVNAIVEMSTDAVQGQSGFYYGKKWQSDLQDYSDGEGKSWGIEVINTIPAWQLLAENPDTVPVRIGLIDNGFDEDHEDLGFAGVYYNEYFVPDTANSSSSHGTHVAGTMAASTSNKTGICGVYPYGDGNLYGVSVSGVQLYSENGSFLSSVIGQKIAFAELIFRNVKVINQSLGFNVYLNKYTNEDGSIDYAGVLSYWSTHDYTEDESTAKDLADFLNRALEKGYDFVIVSAAGNDSALSIGHLESKYSSWLHMISENDYPDVFNRIIVVGAVNSNLEVSYYSNAGERVDVFAPGGDSNGYIYSAVIYSSIFDDRYGNKAGTSMAAPHVSGVAACVWAANNDLTGAEVKEIICSSSSSLCTSCNLIDAYIAVEKAINWETEETVVDSDVEESAEEVQYGGILGWVVNVEDEDVKIEAAQITVTNVDTGETETTTTDASGHFELILPEGNYTLTVTAQGYEDYIWPDGNDFQDPIVVTNEGVNYLDDWIKMTPEQAKTSRKNYYNSDGYLSYYESYAYYDNGLLCSTTLYTVSYDSKAGFSYVGSVYTLLYLYDEDGNLTDTIFDVFTIDYYDENTGEVTFRKGGPNDDYEYISIRPLDESIEQEKYGVDSSKTEIVYGDYPVIPADAENGWAEAYLDEFLVDDEHQSDLEGAKFRLIYIDDDSIPELWIDYLSFAGGSKVCTYYASSNTGREKLNLDLNLTAGYYTDEAGWINTPSQLESGLISFYNETGIAPYVYIIDNVDGNYYPSMEELETFAEEQYEALFADEGHILLVFWDYGGYYEYTLWLGAQTGTIMDSEACDILFDYLDYYYYEADTDEHFFSYAFEKAGEQIMAATESDGGQTDYVYEGQLAKWISGEGLLKTSGGNSGLYYESVYELQNGTFVLLGEGDYEVIYENGEYLLDEQGYEIYDYIWNGVQTTQEEYEQNLSSIFDESKAEDIYQNVYTYNQCKALLQALVNNSLASTSGESSEEILRHMLEAYTDEEILSFLYDDYDLNGTYEAFALCGKAVDGEGYYGTLYFVTESGVQLVREEDGYWTTGEILDVETSKLFQITKYYATGGSDYYYQVSGNLIEETEWSSLASATYVDSEGRICMTDSQYDAMTDGTGHTWNVYYFYWDDGLKEYGGTLINEEEFLSYDGASDILNTIKADGYNVGNIFIRQNGIININASDGECNVNVRVLYENGAVEVSPVGINYYDEGIIYAAMIPEIATY